MPLNETACLILEKGPSTGSGYFVKKVIDHMGDAVSVGTPIVSHNRNVHNLLKDLREEMAGMILTESLVKILDSIRLTKDTYLESYKELADKIEENVNNSTEFTEETKKYFYHIVHGMRVWSEVCGTIMSNG